MITGVQMYTVRDFCKDLDGFAETLKKIADIGYTTVQVSGTCAYEADWLKEQLDKNGLKCVITHTAPDRLQNETAKVAEEHSIFGCDNVGLGYYGFEGEDPKKSFDDFFKMYIPVADKLAENGKYFMYHNHANEFQRIDGKLIMEHIAERFSKDVCGFTLDTFWVQTGGCNPAELIEKLSGRVPVIHLKDYAYGKVDGKFDKKMAVVGEGNLNFDSIFKAAEKAGTQYMMVEQDNCYGEDPFDCLKRSYNYLKSCGFK